MSRLVLTHATVLDGEQARLADATVIVDGERIASVTQGAAAPQPGDEVHDVGGRTVMPGMVTCHFHSAYRELGSRMTPLGSDEPTAYAAVVAANNLHTALRCGYTGAIGAGVANDIDPSMKRAIDDGIIPGPRLVPASRELSTTGHSNDNHSWWWNVPSAGGIRLCDGPDEFRAGIREEIKHGAEIIKLYVTGGHGTTAPKHQIEMTRDELAAAIDTAAQPRRVDPRPHRQQAGDPDGGRARHGHPRPRRRDGRRVHREDRRRGHVRRTQPLLPEALLRDDGRGPRLRRSDEEGPRVQLRGAARRPTPRA